MAIDREVGVQEIATLALADELEELAEGRVVLEQQIVVALVIALSRRIARTARDKAGARDGVIMAAKMLGTLTAAQHAVMAEVKVRGGA